MEDTDENDSYLVQEELVFFVNGKKVVEKNVEPETTLLQYLRMRVCLTGTKLGCGEGGCGACTVMVSKYDRRRRKIVHRAVNACLAPLCSVHGQAVTTVEGIGSTKTRLHPVQERIAKAHGSHCGFCTPGIVMSMYSLLRNNPQPSIKEMESAFEGNLCRCTGYRPILDGFKTFTKEFNCGLGERCCRSGNAVDGALSIGRVVNGCENADAHVNDITGEGTESIASSNELFEAEKFEAYDQSQEPIFPNELQLSDKYDRDALLFRGATVTWHRPVNLDQLLELKSKHPSAKIVTGNTEVGVEVKFKNMVYPLLISPTNVPELNQIEVGDDGILFGASVTLADIDDTLKKAIQTMPEVKTRSFSAVVEMLRWFAGHQIRNVAAVGGNIMTASPISDLNPLFMAAGVVVTVVSKETGMRQIMMDEHFFPRYRQTALKPDEILLAIHIPYTTENEYFFGYKQAHRKEDDIAVVNAGMRVAFEGQTSVVKEMSLAYGGMAPTTVMAKKTMAMAKGREWKEDLIPDMCQYLADDLPLRPDAPGGSVPYRRTLTTSFFFKFYLAVQSQLIERGISDVPKPISYASAISDCTHSPSKSTQVFEEVPPGQNVVDACGRPMVHLSAFKQASGEAVYVDDMPEFKGELYLGLVLTSIAHGKILSVDTSKALAVPGVHSYVDHKDVPGTNKIGPIVTDEEVFVTEKVTCIGQAVGAILAKDQATAQKAAKLVKVEYEEYEPVITIKDAIAAKSCQKCHMLENGDTAAGFKQSDHILEGSLRMGGQEHFYLETQGCIVLPKGEDGEVEVFCSSQSPSTLQHYVAKVLGVPLNRIVVRVKRMGGGFGGKETRFSVVALPAAVAANRVNCPVRIMLDRDEDMSITGTRHPFLGNYKVGFTKTGKILALELDLFGNIGSSMDLSVPVMDRAVLHAENSYKIPNFKCTSYLCTTNIPSNTAFRGFGGPQAMMICEAWMADVAATLNMPPEQVREINLYREGDLTPYGMELSNCNFDHCWRECLNQSNFQKRKKEIAQFNRENRWKKRGLAIIPTKFGISFTTLFHNQAGALVHVYLDGSVLVAHAGTEMGQGLHTKIIQVASRTLGIPYSKIHISETGTNTVPNTSPTAASVGSDLNGMAVLNACNTILERLEPIKKQNPSGTWEKWIHAAYMAMISLSATGFHCTKGVYLDPKTMKGQPFNYFTVGVGCSEVEIDCLTGDHQVLRTDIVMDVGKSLNPAIDIGQIEGAFTQGYGLMMLEEHRHSPKGFLYTRGPGMYKIPSFGNTPIEFNVSLLKRAENVKAVYSSKGIGEPPLFLAASVFHAVRDAISSARADNGITGPFRLESPASAERIRLACVDDFTTQFPPADPGTYKPWDVQA